MNKRILSFVLTLIMLVSLVPNAALTASAAENAIGYDGILVLKQLEGYSKSCTTGTVSKTNYYTGYGTLCTKDGDHSKHVTTEFEADEALRAELKVLDKAVNSFASRNGLSLSQGQHDALVLFSFQNGTAWTTGTGDFQTAIKSGARGSDFLNAICRWNSSTADDDRRKIEANMYLTGQHSTTVPSRYILVHYDPNGGSMTEASAQYYDINDTKAPDIVPTYSNREFMGWYDTKDSGGQQVTALKDVDNGATLYARWQEASMNVKNIGTVVEYEMIASSAVRVYDVEADKDDDGDEFIDFERSDYQAKGKLLVTKEFIDRDNIRWGYVVKAQKEYKDGKKILDTTEYKGASKDRLDYLEHPGWIKLGEVSFAGGSSGSGLNYEIDVTVTVTNTYLRVRAEDSIYSKELRQARMGEQLRIVNTSSGDGFLWGQIADADNDGVCEGWVALMYTNFEEVRGQNGPVQSYNVIAKATVVNTINYVNVRSEAGTQNQIVGALAANTTVDLYEITYVNGIRWGRYSGGWFCLTYANVDGINVDDYVNTSGVLAYAFTGVIRDADEIYTELGGTTPVDQYQLADDGKMKLEDIVESGDTVTVTNLTAVGNDTWGKISVGWVKVTQKISDTEYTAANIILNTAKYYTVVDGVTVRDKPDTGSARVNNLVKGVEFNVNDQTGSKNQIIVVGETIWGYADKVGEGEKTYSGWINLASKYVARGDAPAAGSNNNDAPTGEMATIVGADKVNVRIHHDIYSKILGKIARGTTVAVLGEEDGWYKLDYDVDSNSETDSWVSGKYVEISMASAGTGSAGSTGSTGSTGSAAVETGLGVVSNTYSGVNIRTGAGTGNPAVGKLLPGTTVEILEVTTKGSSKWGRVKEGWICMDYVTMVSNYEILAGLTGGNTGSNNGTVTGAEVAIYTGVVASVGYDVNVRKTTSLDADKVRTLKAGESITLHEILTVTKETTEEKGNQTIITKDTEYWARVNDGYIKDPAIHVELHTLDEATYTVTESEFLNVRSGAGTGNGSLFKLQKGDQVVVTRLQIVDGAVWGYVEGNATEVSGGVDENGDPVYEDSWDGEGWISLAYCTKGAVSVKTETPEVQQPTVQQPIIGAGSSVGGMVTNTSGYRYTGKVINVGGTPLNVRASASDTAKVVTTLNNGASLVIYETYNDGVYAWGRCDAGWVYLYYVDLTPVVNGAVDARVVYNNNTIAYTDMNCTEVAGTYSKMSVIDIYEIVGKMARTDLGWVNTDNLL